jgi:hypothetical protein
VPLVCERVGLLVELLKVHGADNPTNMDDLLLRLSMDVTGGCLLDVLTSVEEEGSSA